MNNPFELPFQVVKNPRDIFHRNQQLDSKLHNFGDKRKFIQQDHMFRVRSVLVEHCSIVKLNKKMTVILNLKSIQLVVKQAKLSLFLCFNNYSYSIQ